MILVNEILLLDLVYEAFWYGKLSNFDRKSTEECFKEYLPHLTYEFDALHLNKKQKVKLKNAIKRHLDFMKAMDKLSKGIIEAKYQDFNKVENKK